ncbi:rano class II histocompatibility antigen, A beta chain-like isoform X1 [Salmo trutta]|uniref:rano class II histocompatibility antigen, A beta chain-like isoform X1 n=1 Tax=Salmo trutta TaxID=8032 RepID=UPI001130BDBE|nr:rano class II histocompatibility antigen, A beta chain-like isoform X1 [Salmo trutta]XP_029593400.1 rano class II histocompatibility antigen, A beta chain-like isoform X1 [Salmo trutta]
MALCWVYWMAGLSVIQTWATPAGGYQFQGIVDCEYDDTIDNMIYFVKNIFNQKLTTIYDSRVQKYVGFEEFGIRNADRYNSQAWKMAIRKAEVETICRYSARFFKLSTLERIVPPIVKVRLTKPSRYGEPSMLECSVLGFYPQEVRVSWLRDGLETTTAVTSTDTLANGDWSYQLHSYLEFRPRRGESVSCMVEHPSLDEPLEVVWDTSGLDAKLFKMAIGVCSVFIGVAMAIGGGVYYWWKNRSGFRRVNR